MWNRIAKCWSWTGKVTHSCIQLVSCVEIRGNLRHVQNVSEVQFGGHFVENVDDDSGSVLNQVGAVVVNVLPWWVLWKI